MTSGVTATSWADLDKLAIARPRADGRATLVARDDRSHAAIAEAPHLSALIAIARVVRGRRAIAETHGGRGVVIYACKEQPPTFLIDAVSAAGGSVFDGTTEHVATAADSLTVQLDATFCDLASAVRRRLKARTFISALEVLEHDVRRRAIPATELAPWWTAVFELCALVGEALREAGRSARWVDAPTMRLPLALDLGGGTKMFPGQLAQAILEGGAGSLHQLIALDAKVAATAGAIGRPMPLLCKRDAVPLATLSWMPIVPEEADHPELPVIVWVEDHGEAITWPTNRGPAPPELQQRALANLAAVAVEVIPIELPIGRVIGVTGDFFAAETILAPRVLDRIRSELGGASTMLIGTPCRGDLMAIDASRAMLDDELMNQFLVVVERTYLRAPERDRISLQVMVVTDRPIGRVQSNLMDARALLRSVGEDPDA